MRPSLIYAAIFLGVLCMSTSSIIIKYIAAPAMIIAFYRVVFTFLLSAASQGAKYTLVLTKISRRDYLYSMTAGFFLALHFGFWITSLNYTSISSSVLFTNLQVIFVLFFSVFILKEKLNYMVSIGIIIALSGCLLIAQGDLQFGKFGGDMLALASGLFVAIYFIIGRDVRKRVSALTYTNITSFMAAIVLLIACLVFDLKFSGYRSIDWLLLVLLALGPGIGGHAVLNWALKYVKAPIVAVSILGESIGASLLAYIFINEHLMWYQMLGGFLIISGIYMAAVFDTKRGVRCS